MIRTDAAREAILALLTDREPGKTICPSEAARSLDAEDWRAFMPVVHEAARLLADENHIALTQGGEVREHDGLKGPYRILKT